MDHGVMFNPTRREFVATGSVAATAALLSPGGLFAAGKDDVLKVGLIGCGGRGSQAIQNAMDADPAVKIVAVGDAFKEKAAKVVERNKNGKYKDRLDCGDRIFGGLDAFQKVIATDCDLVILATPPGFRPQHLEAAVKAGKNVFCEKPVAVDGPGIRKCLEVAEEANKKGLAIVAGTQRRHQKGYLDAIAKLNDGAIGEIIAARVYWNGSEPWFRSRDPKDIKFDKEFANYAGHETDVAYQLNNWYHFNWLCGDHINEQHIHNLDVMNWVLKGHPLSVTAMGGRSHRRVGEPQEVGHIFDHFACEYEYANGVRGFSQCRHAPGCVNEVAEGFMGSKGKAYFQDGKWTVDGKPSNDDGVKRGAYVQEHVDLIRSIREKKPLNELKQVAESTLTAIMGRMAAYTGQKITWDMALNSKEDLMPKDLKWDTKLVVGPVPVPGKTKFV